MESRKLTSSECADIVTKLTRPGVSSEEVNQYYDDWSNTYDEALHEGNYKAPTVATDAVAFYLLTNRDANILDVAAGTGLVGAQLKARGFTKVDGLEPSKGMLNVAKEKGIYRKYLSEYFTNQNDTLKTDTYDLLVCCGAFVDGHMKCDCLAEMIRCVKPGGVVVILMREQFLRNRDEYKKLEPYMKQLEKEGKWTMVDRTIFPHYIYEFDGIRFVFKVTKTSS